MQATVPLACFLSLIRPPGIQFENALLQIAPVDKAKCPFVRDNIDVNFMLYTRHNPTVPHILTIGDDESLFSSSINFNDPTMIYFHAFMETADDGSALMVREAYTYRGDTNVIVVDAQRLEAGPWYFTAAENTWYIGRIGAQFIDFMVSRGLKLSKTHLVGHSLGAQIAGVAGATLQSGRVSRITGLDPALPLFNKLPLIQRLDPSDAEFVDAIHTDAGIFGFNERVGHADFYPNGGISPQPGCELEVVIPKQELLRKCNNTQPKGYFIYYLQEHKQPDKQKVNLSRIRNIITIARSLNNIRSTLNNNNRIKPKKSFKFLDFKGYTSILNKKHNIPKINKLVQPVLNNKMNKPNSRQRRLISFFKPQSDKGGKVSKNSNSLARKIDKVMQTIFKNRTNKANHRQRRFVVLEPQLASNIYDLVHPTFVNRYKKPNQRQFVEPRIEQGIAILTKIQEGSKKANHKQSIDPKLDQRAAIESKLDEIGKTFENVTKSLNSRQFVIPQSKYETTIENNEIETEKITHRQFPQSQTKKFDLAFENETEKANRQSIDTKLDQETFTESKVDKIGKTFENVKKHRQFPESETKKLDPKFVNGTEEETTTESKLVEPKLDQTPLESKTKERDPKIVNETEKPNHRTRRFISFLKPQSEDNSLYKILHFFIRHHKKVIPVITVIREINTLVTTSNGEFNNYIKEQNHYIGTSPSTQTVNYNFDINNESRIMSILKKLFGFGQGNKVSVTTS